MTRDQLPKMNKTTSKNIQATSFFETIHHFVSSVNLDSLYQLIGLVNWMALVIG